MKKIQGLIAVLLMVSALGTGGCSGGTEGQADPAGDAVAATYRGEPIMQSVVENQKETAELRNNTAAEAVSEREIIDQIITNMIVLEEAEEWGLTATEEEVETFLADTVYASYEMPEGKEIIDSYCASAGLTYEEYVQSVREQAPKIIAKAKWEEAVAREYCDANGIEFDSMNPGQEVIDAINDRKADLLEAHRGDIVYCVP